MSAICLAALTAAAFFYALWLTLFRRKLPNTAGLSGLRRRFTLATLLFVGFLTLASCKDKKSDTLTCYAPMPVCYDSVMVPAKPVTMSDLAAVLRTAWRTLDPNQAESFRKQLDQLTATGEVRKKVADMLALSFKEIAYHKQRTSGGKMITCYKMSLRGSALQATRHGALQQIVLLQKAREDGAIDRDTSLRVHAALAREIQALWVAHGMTDAGWSEFRRFQAQHQEGKITATDSANMVAGLIVQMEGGSVTGLSPSERLSSMKERVHELLKKGPAGNDWMDPGIHPNMFDNLEATGLLEMVPRVTCYDRMAGPIPARSTELKELQAKLLDQNVTAGVIDAETAARAAQAPPDSDYAAVTDIRAFQKRIRRITRLLYKNGELPSDFVRELETAIDAEIISFDAGKALRNDMRYHLSTLMWRPTKDPVLAALEERQLIPAARNQRGVMQWPKNYTVAEAEQKKVTEFEKLLDSTDTIVLDGDASVSLNRWQLPKKDQEYRLTMRRVLRAMVKTGLVDANRTRALDDVIGIPVISTIKD